MIFLVGFWEACYAIVMHVRVQNASWLHASGGADLNHPSFTVSPCPTVPYTPLIPPPPPYSLAHTPKVSKP